MEQLPLNSDALTQEALAQCIDHTMLAPDHTVEDIELACEEAIGYGFAAVVVSPYDVPRAARLLAETDIAVGGTVGLPLGHSGLKAKRAEAQTCVDGGADEIDMVINLMAARGGCWGDVQAEIASVRKVAEGKVLKVILECCYLSEAQKVRVCELAVDAGADFVRTSTGFGAGGASAEDVALLKRAVGEAAAVKAAGGLRTFNQCLAMLRAGAARIGTSTGMAIIHDFQETRAAHPHV
jgi:deoxyribose-phosphate aldolase